MTGLPLERVKALLAALPPEDQEELRRYLADILVTPEEAEEIQLASLTETRGGKSVTYTYRQERVRCGKEGCWCSEAGLGHGPYTYKYWKEGGRLRKSYVGKSPPEGEVISRRSDAARGGRARGGTAASSSAPASPG